MAQKRNTSLYNLSDTGSRSSAGGNPRANTERNNMYVSGNTVRRLNGIPERIPEEKPKRELTPEEQQELRRRQAAAKKNRQKARAMSLGYTVFLSCAALVCALFVGIYVYLQADITARMRNVSSLQEEVTEAKAANDAAQSRIESSVSLDEVKSAAIDSLGMQYPESDQIITYSLDSSDYMNQYVSIGD